MLECEVHLNGCKGVASMQQLLLLVANLPFGISTAHFFVESMKNRHFWTSPSERVDTTDFCLSIVNCLMINYEHFESVSVNSSSRFRLLKCQLLCTFSQLTKIIFTYFFFHFFNRRKWAQKAEKLQRKGKDAMQVDE